MALKRVRIERLRCLDRVELELHPERNYLYGPNGAGKTSCLEGIFLLGRGRSFRTRETKRLIQHGARGLSVYGERIGAGQRRLGVAVDTGGFEGRIEGATANGMAELAALLPVHVVDPSLHQLIEGGPRVRRQFIDWGVFHVEQGYLSAWRRYRRVLGQRNAALKAGANRATLDVWTEPLLEAGGVVHRLRLQYVERLAEVVETYGRALLGAPLEIGYRPGWRADQELEGALAASSERDRLTGVTQVGPHRADISVTVAARGVRDEASRGQQKLVAAALTLAQIAEFARERSERGVLLIDDPAAELDVESLRRLLDAVEAVPAQLIVTALSERQLPPAGGFPVFHVKQGNVASVV